jgi:hypothetical protein
LNLNKHHVLIIVIPIVILIVIFTYFFYFQLNIQDATFWDKLSSIATLASFFAVAWTVYFAYRTIKENSMERERSKRVNEAQIYLSLRDLFSKHEEIQKNLKGGKWNERDKGPITESNSGEELAKVDSYLRFFEYCYVLIENKIIDQIRFKDMYGSYIDDIKRNYQIMQTIDEEGWPLFKNLLKILDQINESTKSDSEKSHATKQQTKDQVKK